MITAEEIKKMKKSELTALVKELYQELAEQEMEIDRLTHEIGKMRAAYKGEVGFGAKRNPHVK